VSRIEGSGKRSLRRPKLSTKEEEEEEGEEKEEEEKRVCSMVQTGYLNKAACALSLKG